MYMDLLNVCNENYRTNLTEMITADSVCCY